MHPVSLRRRCLGTALLLAALGLRPGAAAAQTDSAGANSAAAPSARGLTSPAELEAYLDGFMTFAMRDKHVAGATVSVVKDGALYFAKGYGYADWDQRTPVDPATSMFRIGSISKLFTWTAIMQLVEAGELDLNTDINTYLDFTIPATFEEPITLTHVMTHTPGFEEDGRDLFTEDPAHIAPMGEWLASHMPERVRPPGVYSSYSNYATAVAGYIVQRVSGLPFDEYIETHILEPLGMGHTTTRQPLPSRFAADMSEGYQWSGGGFEAKPWEIVTGAAPAGSISASALDMSRFMLAHLGNGVLDSVRILSDSMAERMHSRIFGHDPRLPGFAYGFYEQSSHGLRIFGHGGDTQWFHSDLALIPSERLGIFVSFNTNTGGELSFSPFLTAFLDHYYPDPPPVVAVDSTADLSRFAGEYLFNRRSYSTYMAVLDLAGAIPVSPTGDGELLLESPFGPMRLVRVDSLLFRDATSNELVAFQEDGSGRITHLFLGAVPMMAGEKQSGLHSPRLHQLLLGLGFVVFLGILIAAVIRFFLRKVPGRPVPEQSVVRGRRLMALAALVMVAFAGWLAVSASNIQFLFGDPSFKLRVLFALPVIAALLVIGALWFGVVQWQRGAGTVWMRLRHTLAVLVSVVFFWSLSTWNLLGWHF